MLTARASAATAVLLVALVGALLVLPRLGHRQIVGTHEAVFPIVARDILARHAWLRAELRGRPYRNKPPLYPWAIALFSWRAGKVTEVSARLPGALAVIGAAALTCLIGIRLFSVRVGVWGALILLTSIGFFDQAMATIPDLQMVFFDLLAGLALWSLANDGGWRAGLGFYVALALAVATKGVPGLLPLAVALIWLPIDGGSRRLRRVLWLPGLGAFAAITALWLVPYVTRGRDFTTEVVWRDWLWGPLGVLQPATLIHQVALLALGLLPWAVVLPLAVVAAVRARRARPVAFALCWFVVQGVLVFAVQQQRVRYLLPLLPGAALLVAWWADRGAAIPRRHPVLAGLAIVAAVAGPIAAPVVLRRLDMAPVALGWEIDVVVGGAVLVGTVAATALWAGRMTLTVPVVVASSAVALLAGGWIVEGWENRTWDYRRAATDLRDITLPLGVAALADDHELLQVDFYLGRSLPALRSPDAVSGHLTHAGAVVVDGPRWRSAIDWLRLDPRSLRAEALGADVLLVSRPP